jgi:hypothetical protein
MEPILPETFHRTVSPGQALQSPKLRTWLRYFIAAAILFLPETLPAQVFRGYSSSGTLEFNSRKTKRREVINGYYPEGQLEFVATYRKGKLDGDVQEYYENGLLKAEIPYENGKRDGVAKFYHDNGMLMCKVYYEKDEETGRAKFYDRNGLLTTSVNLDKNRVRQSRRAERYRNQDSTELPPNDSN